MYAFDATYDEDGAGQAERAFYVRSVIELRRFTTFGPPTFCALVVAAALALDAPGSFTVCFAVFLVLSVANPFIFYFLRPAAARRLARKYPVRHIALTPSAVEITAGGQKAVIAWNRVTRVWSAGAYLLLVLGKFSSVNIPARSMPDGAAEFIRSSVKNVA